MILPGSDIDIYQLEKELLADNCIKLGTIFNTLREIIFTVDIEKGMVENVNNSIENLGYTKEDFENHHFKNWNFSKRRHFHFLIKHASHSIEQATSQQILLPLKDGKKTIPYEFSTAIYKIKGKSYLLCVLRDITEREKLLQEVQQALAKEKQLNELRNMFISMASHQFRTPLTIIQSGIEILDMYVEDLPEAKVHSFRKQFTRILGEIESLQDLMNDVLLVGRSDARRTPYKPKRYNLVEFCENLIESKYNNRYTEDRRVLLGVTGEPELVLFDNKLLYNALENILSNAYKYSKQGNINMHIIFEQTTVTVSIADTGIGIPAKDIPNLFEPFYRSDNTSEIDGTGLGLAIVKGFIDIHNGKIFVVSKLNKGTTFSVTLPLNN